jgi:hypothetical protein
MQRPFPAPIPTRTATQETLDAQVDLLMRSDLFDPAWYCTTYPDVGQTGVEPALHFLKYGTHWGRNPGPAFDTRFYQDNYPDVVDQRVIPLVHYLTQGHKEHRFATAQAKRIHEGMRSVRKLQAELWGGLPDHAGPALQKIATDHAMPDTVRFEADYLLAVWLDFQGDEYEARRALERMGTLSYGLARSARRLIPKSILLARHGLTKAAHATLEQIEGQEHEADRRLALANLGLDAEKLGQINSLYQARGLPLLQTRDPSAPLGLDNLTTAPCAPDPDTAGMGKVSVIVPAYKAGAQIDIALRGLCAQTHQDLEIIVVDDASPDDTFDRIAGWAAQDPRIIPLRQPENGGAYAARNRGLAAATGDFITTHDADDWSHPQKIATQLKELAADPDLMGVITHWARVRPPFQFTTNWRLGHALLQWSHSSFLVRRTVTETLGGWEDLRVSADMEFIWRVQAAYGTGAVRRILPDIPMAFALDDAGSLTRAPDTHVRSTYLGLRHYYREISRYWHARAPKGLSPEQQALKWGMIPAALKPGMHQPVEVDVLLRGDCCDPAVLEQMGQIIEADPNRRVGLAHVPDPAFHDRQYGYAIEFPEAFFTLLMHDHVQIACPEAQVTVLGDRRSL